MDCLCNLGWVIGGLLFKVPIIEPARWFQWGGRRRDEHHTRTTWCWSIRRPFALQRTKGAEIEVRMTSSRGSHHFWGWHVFGSQFHHIFSGRVEWTPVTSTNHLQYWVMSRYLGKGGGSGEIARVWTFSTYELYCMHNITASLRSDILKVSGLFLSRLDNFFVHICGRFWCMSNP